MLLFLRMIDLTEHFIVKNIKRYCFKMLRFKFGY